MPNPWKHLLDQYCYLITQQAYFYHSSQYWSLHRSLILNRGNVLACIKAVLCTVDCAVILLTCFSCCRNTRLWNWEHCWYCRPPAEEWPKSKDKAGQRHLCWLDQMVTTANNGRLVWTTRLVSLLALTTRATQVRGLRAGAETVELQRLAHTGGPRQRAGVQTGWLRGLGHPVGVCGGCPRSPWGRQPRKHLLWLLQRNWPQEEWWQDSCGWDLGTTGCCYVRSIVVLFRVLVRHSALLPVHT